VAAGKGKEESEVKVRGGEKMEWVGLGRGGTGRGCAILKKS